jgi:hypothetical protein
LKKNDNISQQIASLIFFKNDKNEFSI